MLVIHCTLTFNTDEEHWLKSDGLGCKHLISDIHVHVNNICYYI